MEDGVEIGLLLVRAITAFSGTRGLRQSDADKLWRGKDDQGRPTWTTLFQGGRFRTPSGLSRLQWRPEGRLVVPAMPLADLIRIGEHLKQHERARETVVDLDQRNFKTKELEVSFMTDGFFAARATKITKTVDEQRKVRFFLDKEVGAMPMNEALHAFVNLGASQEHHVELMMDEELFRWILYKCQRVNADGGYASFIFAELDSGWWSVRSMTLLGPEHMPYGNKATTSTTSKSSTHWFKEGVGLRSAWDGAIVLKEAMVQGYVADGVPGGFSRSVSVLVPASIENQHGAEGSGGTIPGNGRDDRSTDIACVSTTFTVGEAGRVIEAVEDINVSLEHPLRGWRLEQISRKSKTGCPALSVLQSPTGAADVGNSNDTSNTSRDIFGFLGAVTQSQPSGCGDGAEYVRVDSAWRKLWPHLQDGSQTMGLLVTDPGTTHTAGCRGVFPVHRALPIVRVGDSWYNAKTLETVSYQGGASLPYTVRYIELPPGYPSA